MKLNKKLVDEFIRLTKEYYETSVAYHSLALREAIKVLEENVTQPAVELLYDLAKYTQISGKGTYDDIYNALAVFGIIVEDKELENG